MNAGMTAGGAFAGGGNMANYNDVEVQMPADLAQGGVPATQILPIMVPPGPGSHRMSGPVMAL